ASEIVERWNRLVESDRSISGAGRSMGGIGAGPDIGDLCSSLLEIVESESIHCFTDAPTLMRGIDGVQTDFTDLALDIHRGDNETDDFGILLGNIDLRREIGTRELAEIISIFLLPILILIFENFAPERLFEQRMVRCKRVNADLENSLVILLLEWPEL